MLQEVTLTGLLSNNNRQPLLRKESGTLNTLPLIRIILKTDQQLLQWYV
jgi:hypothetical protein